MDVTHVAQRGAWRPVQCLTESVELLRGDYWLFLGIVLVASIIGGAIPIVLLGPGFCAIYLALFRKLHGERMTFDVIGEGFQYFLPSLGIVAAGLLGPLLVIYGAIGGGAIAFIVLIGAAHEGQREALPPMLSALMVVMAVVGVLLYLVLCMVMQGTLFGLMLLVDRGLPPMTCLKLGLQAVWRNMAGLIGYTLLSILLILAGYMACCIGVYFVIPYIIAGMVIGYRQMFPPVEAGPIGVE